MDRATILDHLAQARRHVLQGERHIMRQREIIASLDDAGLDNWQAWRLLQQFQDLQQLHVGDRDRLERELAELDK